MASPVSPNVRRIVLSDFEENAYVISNGDGDECVVVDPGMGPEPLIAQIQASKLTPRALLITHGHWDHIAGIAAVREVWPDVPICVGENDASKLTDPNGNLSAAFGFPQTTLAADCLLKDGERFAIAGIPFEAREIPGHSRGHVVYVVRGDDKNLVFCGDVVFRGSVGRTDFPDSDGYVLIRGIRQKILPLPNGTILFPGHGPETTVGEERENNPFISR